MVKEGRDGSVGVEPWPVRIAEPDLLGRTRQKRLSLRERRGATLTDCQNQEPDREDLGNGGDCAEHQGPRRHV